ncbi:MAG: TRAP transporter substrate-binding protein [Burkholderiaceae bacterium]|jgi:TRAP-type mannitol/chloroaromatic compound transport system substrate-binding protein|nr:TRAP transporter substrate-binding protein [Burkholderiaceae bacterium]
MTNATSKSAAKRQFLRTAAIAGAAAVGVPAVARAQAPTTLRMQSAWPAKDIFHEFATDFAKKVSEISGGRLQIQMLPAGSVVGGLQVVDAVNSGTLDGAHAVPGFWFGKNSAFGLFGAGPNFGMDANQLLGWMHHGGGDKLYAEVQAAARLNIQSLMYGPVPTEPLGWFKKEVRTLADLKGVKYRTAGLAVPMMAALGMAPVQMAPGEIVPALDRGLLDAAEFANATGDRLLGFPDVAKFYYQRSFHMANNVFELMINAKRLESLAPELKSVLRVAADACSAEMSWKAMDRMSTDYIELQTKQGVRAIKTPPAILDAQLKAWDGVVQKYSAENPLFAKVVESQRAWARRVVFWSDEVTVNSEMAYRHFFPRGPLGA